MQQKLDDLCEQMNSIKSNSRPDTSPSFNKNVESLSVDVFGCDKIKFVECGCWHCDHHHNLFANLMVRLCILVGDITWIVGSKA